MSDPHPHDPHDPRNPADHLKGHRWPKGRSGNPGGRPKGASVSAQLRKLLAREHNGRRLADLLAERLVKDALQGKLGPAREVINRTEGTAPAEAAAAPQTIKVVRRELWDAV